MTKMPRKCQGVVVYVHVRRELVERHEPLEIILGEINEKIIAHGGIVLADRQILTDPIQQAWHVEPYFTDDLTAPFEHPFREWGAAQRNYFLSLFGVSDPYQYALEPTPYNRFCIGALVPRVFLQPGERVLALIDAVKDHCHVYCRCHSAEIVYTTSHRAICMNCGHTHCVLAHPLAQQFGNGLSNEEWETAFDSDGALVDDNAQIALVEYQDILAATKIWETDVWEEASSDIEFFCRGDPEEVARYRATQATPQDLREAGFSEVPTAPPLAAQIAPYYFGVDIAQNAAVAFNAGLRAFGKSALDGEEIRQACLSLFQAIELILKVKLEVLDPNSTALRVNNPSLIKALSRRGIVFGQDDLDMLDALRSLRNKLQHGCARFGYRATRQLLARAIVFFDAFSLNELGWWCGEIAEQPGWNAALSINPIRVNALREIQARVAEVRDSKGLSVEDCPICGMRAAVRERGHAASCLYCKSLPGDVGGRGR